MPPRADDTPPRRGAQPRRGTSRDVSAEGDEAPKPSRGFGGIGDARAYTPRGRTVAERDQRTRSPRAGRTSDPFRPALQVLDGGQPPRRGRPAVDEPSDRVGKRTPERKTPEKKQPPRSRRPEPEDDDEDDIRPVRRTSGRIVADRERVRTTAAKPGRTTAAKPGRTGRPTASPRTGKAAGPRRTVSGPRVDRAVRAVAPEPPRLANSTRRLRVGAVVALSLFAMIGIRLVVLQVASSPEDAQRLVALRKDRLAEVRLPAPRGSIFDREGAVLAHSVKARFVAADPGLIKDPVNTAAILSPMIGVAQSELVPLMTPHKRPDGLDARFEFLKQGVDISVGDRIKAMELPGIVVKEDERRDVPNADLAANLIGFTGADNSGLEGLEARYDSLLRGTDGERQFEIGKGDLNKPIPGGFEKYTEPQPGTSLQLTIDSKLQYEVQRILAKESKRTKATMAGAVVIDVKTGEVLAQASYPMYNAAKPGDYKPTEREDAPSSVVADPGSVHKAFIFGAALQEGLISDDSVLTIGPAVERGGYRFQDGHMQKKGTKMTMPGLLALSSNVGTILIAERLGKEKVVEYQRKFGLGRSTNEGMPGEAEGRILAPEEWSGSAYGSVPIGMSVDATLVQMAAGYAAIANDGVYIQPRLIKSMISGRDGEVTEAAPPATHKVLDPGVAAQLRSWMESVVDNKGATGTQAAVPAYRVAGKTGTGKRLIDGQYTSANYGSFIGMAPAENPRFVIAVSADVPVGTGGDVAAPAFSEMMSYALLHYRVPPSSTPAPKFKIHP
ncbi:penicillin-binding protein PbpB [Paractinoplanes abujensis]|uniref:Cell division protein FtsI (Penicillin-binding protein 3) n=1 Tax=Paractinoplanes abujensis TaxID=882441 RepID=A0A7W7G4X3_9ACTN|nr:penicillin-binding protein 2 [Actinoplanes abujensis]MBB4694316.1 cell division protein FtsI (penicillin-binding protein 3) [Actinoplanes abujensis]GID20470.1 penicillin-binding protein PbpB [Actinoplanes abujensis]